MLRSQTQLERMAQEWVSRSGRRQTQRGQAGTTQSLNEAARTMEMAASLMEEIVKRQELSSGGRSNLQGWATGMQDASAGIGVFTEGLSQGVTLQNLLGAAGTGFAAGGPVGAAIGVGLDLLGGLFHHTPAPPPIQGSAPAEQFAPAEFDYLAYRYRLMGNLQGADIAGSQAAMAFSQPAPQVHIYLDGVQTAAGNVLKQQTAATSASAVYYDLHRPV